MGGKDYTVKLSPDEGWHTKEAEKYIKIAIQGKTPLKEAVNLSNEISKAKQIKIVTILVIITLIKA